MATLPVTAAPRPLPHTGAVTGVLEALAFFRDPAFASRRFAQHGNVFATRLLGQRLVFVRGGRAVAALLETPEASEGWWPESVRQLLGSRSLANRNGPDHRARRRVVGQLFSVPLALPGTPFARALAARARLLERLGETLRATRRRAAAGEPVPGGLDLLLGGLDEAGLPLEDDDLVEQLLLLLFAGYETTASSLSCLMAAVLAEPEVQAWLRPEIAALPWPPAAAPAGGPADGAAAPRLAAVVNEVMRLTPPVGGFFRRTTRPLELDGVLVPAGEVVQVALAATHRHREPAPPDASSLPAPEAAPDDLERFRPQRHLDGEAGLTLLPFGGGERVCLGKALAELEIRLMAVGLLRGVPLALVPNQDLTLVTVPSPSPRGGLLVEPAAAGAGAAA